MEGDGSVGEEIKRTSIPNPAEQPLLEHQGGGNDGCNKGLPKVLIRCLYAGHFLSRWSARMWEFSVALYMINIWPNSLLLTALYGVVESASVALFGPIVGQLVDKLTYVKVLQLWSVIQNLSFIVAGSTVILLLHYSDLKTTHFPLIALLVALTNVSGAVGMLSTLSGTILIEREWVVVISEDQPAGVLTKLNSVIRRIDLACKLFAPVVSGLLMSFISLTASAIGLAFWNVLSVCFLYFLLILVYKGIPSLREKELTRAARRSSRDPEQITSVDEHTQHLLAESIKEIVVSESSPRASLVQRLFDLPCLSAWKVYLKQDVVLAGFSLALLYFTVLSFGSLMTAVLEWDGIPAYVIAIARGISATIGITATFTYPIFQSHISTIRTGLWSIWSQWSFLLVSVGSILIQNDITSAYMLMGGVAASRLGLWMFDLAVIQQMQDQVPESDRCVVGGVQNSLQSTLDLMGYVMGILVSDPKDFWKLILLSFSLVTLAGLLYTLYVRHVRKHLFHFEKLFVLAPWLFRLSH
ncbi:Solute carrier family 40 member 2-like protein [Drosera capensis]